MMYEDNELSDEETQEIMTKMFQEGTKFPVANPFSRFTFDALQLLTEALFVFSEIGHRMGYDRNEVNRIAMLTDEAEKEQAIQALKPNLNGPLLTDEERLILGILDHFSLEAMTDLEAHEIAKEVIPDIENFLKDK